MTQDSSGYPDQGPPPSNPYGQPQYGQPQPPSGAPYGGPPQPVDPYGAPGGYGAPQSYGSFYISAMGAEQGPFDLGTLSHMALNRQIKSDVMVRSADGQQWFPAKEIPGLFSQKEWLVAALLSWFVGYLGVDRFYLGHIGLGVAKLLTCGGLGIWAIIDFVLIIMRKVNDSDGRPLR